MSFRSIQQSTVKDILELFYDNEVVIGSFNLEKRLPHLSYGYKGVDYTTSKVDTSMNDPIIEVWVKGLRNRRNNIAYNENKKED